MLQLDPLTASSAPRLEYTAELDGVTITYRLQWDPRCEAWYVDLVDAAGTTILAGARVNVGWPIGHRHRIEGMPSGRLFLVDVSGADEPPTLESLGAQHQIVYLSAAEVAELAATATVLDLGEVTVEPVGT